MTPAPSPPADLRERVARAMWEADWSLLQWPTEPTVLSNGYLRLADAAISTICTPVEGAPAGCGAEAALRRVLDLAAVLDAPTSPMACRIIADRIRDAAGGTA